MSDERARWRIAGLAALAVAAVVLVVAINPANLPESWLERWLEAKLPPGSSIVAVRSAIEEKDWQTVEEWISDDGSQVLVLLGRGWPARDYAYIRFSFDRFGRLTNVDVEKHTRVLERQSAGPSGP